MNKMIRCLLPAGFWRTSGVLAALILGLLAGVGHAGGPRPIMNQQELKSALQEIGSKHDVDRQELESLLLEFEEMRQTDERDVEKFTVRVATPARVDRLFQIPEVALLPRSLRENGLIFAGYPGSKLLVFQKPSDVIARVSSWFPGEIARARSANQLWGGRIHLWGPFEKWETESSAFMAMWNCVPQIAWLQPDRSPFRQVRSVSHPLMPLGAQGSGYTEFDFGRCVRERNGYIGGFTVEESVKGKERVRAIAGRVVPVLQGKFASFLRGNRCRGTGPDDCVLILHLWASLTPDDPELATTMQSLEADVALDSPLPDMKRPYASWSPKDIDAGEDRFDEVWRRAAFLRAKLVSILGATNAWPADALNRAVRQLIALQQWLEVPYAHHFDYVDMDYRTPASSPWMVLYSELRMRDTDTDNGVPAVLLPWEVRLRDPETVRRVRAVVAGELGKLEGKVGCGVFKPWLTPVLKAEIALGRLQSAGHMPECIQPDWDWLAKGASEDAVRQRAGYLDIVPTANAQTREMLLGKLTHDGDDCFKAGNAAVPDWQRKLCRTWIHEPATVTPTLGHTRLVLDKRNQFTKLSGNAPDEGDGAGQHGWLTALVAGMPAEARSRMGAYVKELDRKGPRVKSATLWRHAGHSRALIELGLADGDCTRLFVLLSPHELRQIGIPGRIWHGSLCHSEIVRVSDLDEDGNLELWWALEAWGAASFDSCKGDDSDLERNLDCSAKSLPARMAEIDGDTLTWFVDNRGARPRAPAGENWTATGNAYPLPTAAAAARSEAPCNRVLIGSVLAPTLEIEGWGENGAGGRQVIDIACAGHPVNPDLTLVALFHELSDLDPASDESEVGFVVAVIDVKRGAVLRMYRDSVMEDATTRIRGGNGTLRLDTARYNLAPDIRAFGVRMHTGYSPRYADGGSNNYLTLFVEEGKVLRPVLKDLTMSSWTMKDSGGCFAANEDEESACLIEREEKHIALSSTSTNGWRDLDVIATTTREGEPGTVRRATERKLRYEKGEYR